LILFKLIDLIISKPKYNFI